MRSATNTLRNRATHRRVATSSALVGAAICMFSSFSAPAEAATYDLVVSTVRPAAVNGVQATGAPLTFRATIKNRGAAPTPEGVIHGVSFRVDGRVVSWSDYSTVSIPAGGSVTVHANGGPAGSAAWLATSGRHQVVAEVDDVDRLPGEGNEQNNTRQVAVTVAPVKPVTSLDAVPGLTEDQYRITHGKDVQVSWAVPAGQPVGTKYVLTEHSEAVVGEPVCGFPNPDVVKATASGPLILITQISTGRYCLGGHGGGNRVSYVVTATAGTTTAVATSGICDWYTHTDSMSGDMDWRFACDGAPALTDYCQRTECRSEPGTWADEQAAALAVRTGPSS